MIAAKATRAGAQQARKEIAELNGTLAKYRPGGVNTYRLLATANDLDIPVRHFMPGFFALGLGNRSRWMQSTVTDRTAALASQIANNKFLTATVLREAGLAAPTHQLATTADEAVRIARELGYPVVVKPADAQQGRGVAANLASDREVIGAFAKALEISKHILVEKHFDGNEFRITVLGGKVLRVSARLAGGVTGDGESTIAELVKKQKESPEQQRRAGERGHALIDMDDEARELLVQAGLSPESVLPDGKYQPLRRRANVSAGGMLSDVAIGDVHPENIGLAERAVRTLRLDLGGVDVILPDIARSWIETGGLICEVNSRPQIGRRLMRDLLNEMLKGGGRIPTLLVVGAGAGLAGPQPAGDLAVGFGSVEGLWLGPSRLGGKQPDGFTAGQRIANNPDVGAAIIVMDPNEVAHWGLPVDRCDLVVLESPDQWNARAREMLGDVLATVLPHAARAVCLEPADALRDLHPAPRLKLARADSLQRIRDDFIVFAAERVAAHERVSSQAPARSAAQPRDDGPLSLG
jgi:cyanophycin synthetase